MTDKRSKILARVQALYAKAASTDFGPEADAFTSKADALMLEWAIEEAELAMDDPQRHQFEIRTFVVMRAEGDAFYTQWSLMQMCAEHCGLKRTGDYGTYEMKWAGARSDLDYMELMYTSLLGHLVRTLDPRPDPALSEAANLYSLKIVGLGWKEVHRRMYPDVPWERRHGVRYTGVVKKYAETHDLPRNMVGGVTAQSNYREQYAMAYISRIGERLREIRGEQEEARTGAALVLFDKDAKLNEFLWEKYPNLRPHPADCDCDTCHRCSNPTCQRPRCVNARRPVRRRSAATRQYSYNPTANAAGRRAANTADLGQTRVGGKRGELG